MNAHNHQQPPAYTPSVQTEMPAKRSYSWVWMVFYGWVLYYVFLPDGLLYLMLDAVSQYLPFGIFRRALVALFFYILVKLATSARGSGADAPP